MNKKDFTFIVPAAGESRRFNSKKNKIFYKYKNKALILHVFDKCLKFTKNIIIPDRKSILIDQFDNKSPEPSHLKRKIS